MKNKFKKIIFTAPLVCMVWLNSGLCFDVNDDDLSLLAEYEQSHGLNSDLRLAEIEPLDLAILFSQFPLQQPLWDTTETPHARDVVDLFPQKFMENCTGINVSLFLNASMKMPVSARALFGSSLQEQEVEDPDNPGTYKKVGFIPLLKMLLDGATGDIDVANPETLSQDVVTMLPFLKRVVIQEYKVGCFLQGMWSWKSMFARINTSSFVAVRNFWLGVEDQRDIAMLMAQHFKGADFDYHELYKIRAGIGDTRVALGCRPIDSTKYSLGGGVQAIIPTSVLVTSSHQDTDEVKLVEHTPISTKKFMSNATQLLSGVRDNLLYPQIGNHDHWAAGIFCEGRVSLFHRLVDLWGRVSLDHFFEGKEDKLFMRSPSVTIEDLDALSGSTPPDETARVVNAYVGRYLFPSLVRATVEPGNVYRAIIGISTNVRRWRFKVGYDFYARQRPRVRALHNTPFGMGDFDIERSLPQGTSHQSRFFSESQYLISNKKVDWTIGWGSDFVFLAQNMAKDWTFYLTCSIGF